MKHLLLLLLTGGVFFFAGCRKGETKITDKGFDNGPTDSLKLNEIQVIASHNSYHKRTDADVFNFMLRLDSLGVLPANMSRWKTSLICIMFAALNWTYLTTRMAGNIITVWVSTWRAVTQPLITPI